MESDASFDAHISQGGHERPEDGNGVVDVELELGSDEEFVKTGHGDPDASKGEHRDEDKVAKGVGKVVDQEMQMKNIDAAQGGRMAAAEQVQSGGKKSRPVKLANVGKDPELYRKEMQSKKTQKTTDWAVSVFNDTMSAALGDEHRDLHKIPSKDMPDILGQFYMLVLKKDGEPMNASSLGTLHQSLARFLSEDHPEKVDIKSDVRFKVAKANLKAAQKASCEAGQVPGKKRSEPFQDQHLAKCWDGGSLGRGDPRALAATVHLICMSQLGFRAVQECVQMRNEDIVFGEVGRDGIPTKLTVSERVTKTRQGGRNGVRELNPTAYADPENVDTCPVRTIMAFQGRKTKQQRDPSQRFFLGVKQSAQLKPGEHEFWYTSQPMGEKELPKLIPNSFVEVGVDPHKNKYTATSTRKSSLETGVGQGVPGSMLQGLAGHANANSLRSYVKGTAKSHEAMSLIVSRKFGQKKVGRFEEVVSSIEEAQEKEREGRVGDQGQQTAAEEESSACRPAQSQVPSAPTPQVLPQSVLPGIPPFGFPATSFQQQLLMAQQLSLASNPHLMMMPPPQFFQPSTMPFLTNQAPPFPAFQAPPPVSYQLEKEVADLQKQQENRLADQRKFFEEQLRTRDQLFKEQLETRDREFAERLQRMAEQALVKGQEENMEREKERWVV